MHKEIPHTDTHSDTKHTEIPQTDTTHMKILHPENLQ